MANTPLQLVVLISGNGSNLQAIIDAIAANQVNANIACVISNRADAYGLHRAQQHQIPTHIVKHEAYPDRTAYDQALIQVIDQYQPDLVALAGFMRILGNEIVQHYHHRMINIHPSLLPKYRGLHTHQQVLANGDKQHGCTVHYVTTELDGGPIIRQAQLTVLPDDDVDSLKARVQQLEHKLYPDVIQWFTSQDQPPKLQH